jgi:prophage DNA circulation protein
MSFSSIIPASFRGIPINVFSYDVEIKPQTAVHTGPFWQNAIVENLGKAPRSIKVKGFLVGDFSIIERGLLQAAIFAPGSGLLTLPTYGLFYVTCLSSTWTEDVSNMIECSFDFLETASPMNNTVSSLLSGSLPDGIGNAIADVQTAVTNDIASVFS